MKYKRYLICTICFLSFVLILFYCNGDHKDSVYGYVEGDFSYVSSESLAKIDRIVVERGQKVEAGQELVIMDNKEEKKQYEIANKNMLGEIATLNDLLKGQRSTELNIVTAQIAQANHDAGIARLKLEKYQKLKNKGYVSEFEAEQARADSQLKQERVRELIAQRESQQLPARVDKIAAQKAKIGVSKLKLEQSQIALDKRLIRSPGSAIVYDIMHHTGEIVSQSTPIISLLPDGALKVRFFVNDEQFYRISLGKRIQIKSGSSKGTISAEVKFISPKAEYTPPVIYNDRYHDRSVFMIEARPINGNNLKLGEAVEILL